jgi:ABC-type nickel/cobalt efflux system permease component RcnA
LISDWSMAMKTFNRLFYLLMAVFGLLAPSAAWGHLVNSNVGEFYAGMLHPVTSAEHILPMVVLALLASQCGKKAARICILVFPLVLMGGILAGNGFPLIGFFHFANLAAILILGFLLVFANRLIWLAPAGAAGVTGLILGWRSGADWAVSGVGWQFIPGAALTGFIVMAVIAAWVPRASEGNAKTVRKIAGTGFSVAGAAMMGQLMIGDGPAVGRSIGLPTEESLKALVAAPELSLSFILGAFLVAMVWGAAHALTPGHGKAIVGAYLVGTRGTAWHAIYLGLTVTVTHTLGVFMLGLAATLAASHVAPEKLYPWLGILSGMIVFILGAVMFANRIKSFSYNAERNHHHDHNHSNGHIHDHRHDHPHDHENHHHHTDHSHSLPSGHPADVHQHPDHHPSSVDPHPHRAHHPDHDDDHTHHHSHGHLHHHHGGQRHSHLPPGADGSPVTWRSLLTLGISGGLLPCPSALVLLLTAIALHRIGFGLALVTAFSLGLAGVLTVVGLLFIKGSRLIDRTPSFAAAGRWMPATSALVVCLLGGGITWGAISTIMGG